MVRSPRMIAATVTVNHGNSRVRKGGSIGQIVAFDLTTAKLRVADTHGDGVISVADLLEGDKVVLKATLPVTPGRSRSSLAWSSTRRIPRPEDRPAPSAHGRGAPISRIRRR